MIAWLFDLVVHLDKHLLWLMQEYGNWIYLILFLVIFAETGFVFTPFLPGDSLIFGIGALAAVGSLRMLPLFVILAAAAILGDSANYAVGSFLSPKILRKGRILFIRKEHIRMTQEFYRKHGKKTIILARFVPIVRTFAPFMAGIGRMDYREFLAYNVAGGIAWISIFLFGGYLFGNLPLVRDNFSLIIGGIIIVSLLPFAWELFKMKRKS